jgi:hypothetical protein
MEGMDGIQSNIRALRNRLLAAAGDAADESAHLLESYAKATAPFTDRTGNLRNSIKGTSTVSTESARMVISASMNYAPWVELGSSRARPYAFLWPTVAANVERVQGIFQRHMKI